MRIPAAVILFVSCSTVPLHAGPPSDLATIVERTSHRASSYDRAGGNVDSLVSFEPGATHTLLATEGPGQVTHLWMTLAVFPGNRTFMRDLVLRMYWERSDVPSVEVPLGDFFALGHGRRYPVESAMVAVGHHPSALNCYWPMPFHRHARIELYNSGQRSIRRFYYHIDYELGPIPGDQGLFHAAYRRDRQVRAQPFEGNTTGSDNYVALDVKGRGHFVGCVLSVDGERASNWFEGDDMIFIDDAETPTIFGTGTEDYFSNAWGYREPFSYPYYGAPLFDRREDGGINATFYRWHVADPIRFNTGIRVTFETLFEPGLRYDYASVAYWYQLEPIASREPLPEDNHPIDHEPPAPPRDTLDATELEPLLRRAGIAARAMTAELYDGYHHGGYLRIETHGRPVEIPIPVDDDGVYRVSVKPVNHLIEEAVRIGLRGSEPRTVERLALPAPSEQRGAESRVPFVEIGEQRASEGVLTLVVSGNPVIGLDHLRVSRIAP